MSDNMRVEVALAWAGRAGKVISTFVLVLAEGESHGYDAPSPATEISVLLPRLHDGSLPATQTARIEHLLTCRLQDDPLFHVTTAVDEIANPLLRGEVAALLGKQIQIPHHIGRGIEDVLYICHPTTQNRSLPILNSEALL